MRKASQNSEILCFPTAGLYFSFKSILEDVFYGALIRMLSEIQKSI